MLTKNRIRLIRSLETRRHRIEEGLFVAEGPKLVGELLAAMSPRYVAALPQWIEANAALLPATTEVDAIGQEELQRISFLRAPQQVLALFDLPRWTWDAASAREELCLALDGVQDPGNLGTICRVADWFGIQDILCSHETADIFNPKAVQATMGALARVRLHYVDLPQTLAAAGVPVFGTFLDGKSIYGQTLSSNGIIVMGNEGNGISPAVEQHVTQRLLIPNFPAGRQTTESLNVAIATSIVCAEFRRRQA
ncbi:MAG: RNA methyltransferase [Bacteroidaceae bacterium]|nr:RNA methyltransferase [Bacteroidaceae bacterium]MBQ3957508.1 RNA methyltransferase [Bacteroidaceae bacterium]MBQ3993089.1 RNA methyltransferase [Bacteroidaceae bacterium]